ncbi:putative E3 ubiquitin-protein ligase BAH1 [Helianthus annuus]|nr:putative E3 ubiquitin-protein ligase BAH1 [Helianthus annuus]KAJ0651101.1 putative E3 ubiquitin-protein ligase BAH1 [Helianthus annuus]
MKFCKKYEEYMQTHDQKKLPGVGFKNLKKILKRCRSDVSRSQKLLLRDDDGNKSPSCVHHCAGVCLVVFFMFMGLSVRCLMYCHKELILYYKFTTRQNGLCYNNPNYDPLADNNLYR